MTATRDPDVSRSRETTCGARLCQPRTAPLRPAHLHLSGDFAHGLVTLGTHDAALGQVWHLPSAATLTTRAFIGLVYEVAGHQPKLSVMPSPLLALIALVNPTVRAVREQAYQTQRPFVVDHLKFADAFGADVTPHREAIAVTLRWFEPRQPRRNEAFPSRSARRTSVQAKGAG